jgi:hypothetical protein
MYCNTSTNLRKHYVCIAVLVLFRKRVSPNFLTSYCTNKYVIYFNLNIVDLLSAEKVKPSVT